MINFILLCNADEQSPKFSDDKSHILYVFLILESIGLLEIKIYNKKVLNI